MDYHMKDDEMGKNVLYT